jgi:hypothetical protein
MAYPAEHLSVSINRPDHEVYRFLIDPRNLPLWAAGLARGIRQENNQWIADSPMGRVIVAFVKENEFCVADHLVTLADGKVVRNPVRVISNQHSSEIVFTLFRLPEMSDDDYARDTAMVKGDLARLKTVLEGSD